MYDPDDPRASLGSTQVSTGATTATPPDAIAVPEFHDFHAIRAATGTRCSVVRAQNVVIVHSAVEDGDELDSGVLQTESAVVVTEHAPEFDLLTDDGTTRVDEPGLLVIPPGYSRISARGAGSLVQLFEVTEQAWAERSVNRDSYAEAHPRVTPLSPWPAPVGGPRVRFYPLSQVPGDPARFGRIFRTRAFMVNFLLSHDGPRDPHKLSPHTHVDFEQLSLAVQGSFVHHIRTPWLGDRTGWRDDDHVELGSASVAIIPPPTVHTSEAVGAGVNTLIDIFSPPRVDFSAKPGWVLNADDYPTP